MPHGILVQIMALSPCMNTTHHTRDYSCSASEQRFKGSATATPGQLVIGARLSSNEPGLVSILSKHKSQNEQGLG